jgi:hypothetical protein
VRGFLCRIVELFELLRRGSHQPMIAKERQSEYQEVANVQERE